MTEQQRYIQNRDRELKNKKERRRKQAKRKRIVNGMLIAAAFLLGCVCGKTFSKADIAMAENVIQPEDNKTVHMKPDEEGFQETGADRTDLFADIPNVTVEKPVDYTLYQALDELKLRVSSDARYEKIIENAGNYPEQLLVNLANNPELLPFVADYEGIMTDDSGAVLTDAELQEKYPLFLQWDKRWGYLPYGDESNIAVSGCGPTTLSMAVVALTGNKTATPADIARFAMNEGYYMYGTGTRWSLMTEGAAAYGLESEQIDIGESGMKECLDRGGVIICSVREGDFTVGGHFILIYGYDKEGFFINDPFCLYRSRQKWPYGQIKSQIKALWALYS